MAQPESSCLKWGKKQSQGPACVENCFEPKNARCADYQIVDAVPRDPSVIKAFLEPEPPVRRFMNVEQECCKRLTTWGEAERDCTICAAQNSNISPNLCSTACRPQKTILHLKEWTKRPLPKPTYKHCVWLDGSTCVGRAFPMKFRFRRIKNKCADCGSEVYFRQPVTEMENLILLSNCCDIEVYHRKKLDNMPNVPVTTMTGQTKFYKKTLVQTTDLDVALPCID